MFFQKVAFMLAHFNRIRPIFYGDDFRIANSAFEKSCSKLTKNMVIIKILVSVQIKSDYSIYENLQILGFSLLDKTPINEILTKP